MNIKHRTRLAAIGFMTLVAATLGAGCTAVVSPHVSEAEFLSTANKRPDQIDLYISEDFRTHRETQQDVMDMKSWDYDLGPVATDAFKYAFESSFERVNVMLGTPHFPLPETDTRTRTYVVQPAFAGFDAHFPYVFKFETYTAQVSFRVVLYDAAGKPVMDQTFSGEGSQQGSIGSESAGHAANPVAAQNAIKQAVEKAVGAISTAIATGEVEHARSESYPARPNGGS